MDVAKKWRARTEGSGVVFLMMIAMQQFREGPRTSGAGGHRYIGSRQRHCVDCDG